jgi:hypothetical protein
MDNKLFNCYVNTAGISSEGQETQILFIQKSLKIGKDSKPVFELQEQAIITMTFEYAKQFLLALQENIDAHEKNLTDKANLEKRNAID